MQSSKHEAPGTKYFFCFYQCITRKHRNYHHVIIKKEDGLSINSLEDDDYMYFLNSEVAVFLDEEKLSDPIIRGLLMDGESLVKRFKAQQNLKSIQTK